MALAIEKIKRGSVIFLLLGGPLFACDAAPGTVSEPEPARGPVNPAPGESTTDKANSGPGQESTNTQDPSQPTSPSSSAAAITVTDTFELASGTSKAFGNLTLTMRADGNLVLLLGARERWSSNTAGRCTAANVCKAAFQTDGALVVLKDAQKIFSSGTEGNVKAQLVLDEGQFPMVKILSNATALLWPIAPTDVSSVLPRSYLDLVLQDVCVDSAGVALPIDPIACEAYGYKRRDLNYGEAMPYHKYDLGKQQRSDSYPMYRGDGTWMALSSMDFGPKGAAGYGFGDSDPSDGFNTLETAGGYYAFTSTQDGAGGYQPIWGNSGTNDDSWLIGKIGVNFSTPEEFDATLSISRTPQRPTTPNSYTAWVFQPSFTFTRGKKFATYIAYHHSRPQADMSNMYNAAEQFFFTPHYGFTRWESWTTYYQCARDLAPLGYDCDGTGASAKACSGATTEARYGHPWVRVDCRDWAQPEVVAVPTSPFAYPMPEDMTGSSNQIKNSTFAGGSVDSWSRTANIDWVSPRRAPYDNAALHIGCKNCANASVYQVASVSNIARSTSAFRTGVKMWSTVAGTKAEVVVVQNNAAGQQLARDTFAMTLGTSEQQYENALTNTQGKTAQLVYYVVPVNNDSSILFDDPWVAALANARVPTSGNGGGFCGISSGCKR
jgi:hypothetical protein